MQLSGRSEQAKPDHCEDFDHSAYCRHCSGGGLWRQQAARRRNLAQRYTKQLSNFAYYGGRSHGSFRPAPRGTVPSQPPPVSLCQRYTASLLFSRFAARLSNVGDGFSFCIKQLFGTSFSPVGCATPSEHTVTAFCLDRHSPPHMIPPYLLAFFPVHFYFLWFLVHGPLRPRRYCFFHFSVLDICVGVEESMFGPYTDIGWLVWEYGC